MTDRNDRFECIMDPGDLWTVWDNRRDAPAQSPDVAFVGLTRDEAFSRCHVLNMTASRPSHLIDRRRNLIQSIDSGGAVRCRLDRIPPVIDGAPAATGSIGRSLGLTAGARGFPRVSLSAVSIPWLWRHRAVACRCNSPRVLRCCPSGGKVAGGGEGCGRRPVRVRGRRMRSVDGLGHAVRVSGRNWESGAHRPGQGRSDRPLQQSEPRPARLAASVWRKRDRY
jgi:hypothetical protein